MENILTYLIRSSLIVTIVFLGYQLLKNDRSFRRNRILLLSGIILSFLLPLISFIPSTTVTISGSVLLQPVIINEDGVSNIVNRNPDIFSLLMIIYISGIVILLLRNAIQLFKLYRLVKRSGISNLHGYNLVNTKEGTSPFSFFKFIFINKQVPEREAETILAHEMVHIDQHHSVDVMLMEALTILLWFNPVVWFYRKQLREIHEYQADNSILNNGTDKAGYLQLLCAMALKVQPADITNSFCQIKLKRRLKMITKSRNSRLAGVKFTVTLPLLALFIWLVSCNDITKETNAGVDDNENKKTEATQPGSTDDSQVYNTVEEMPEYPGGNAALNKFIIENIAYPKTAKESGLQGAVYVSFIVDTDGSVTGVKVKKGIGGGCDEEAMRVVKMMPKWKPGTDNGKKVKVSFTLPIKFQLS